MRITFTAILIMTATAAGLVAQIQVERIEESIDFAGLWVHDVKSNPTLLHLKTDGTYIELTLGTDDEQREIGAWEGIVSTSPKLHAKGYSVVLLSEGGERRELILLTQSEYLCHFTRGLECFNLLYRPEDN